MIREQLRKLLRIEQVYAHCDIPCGIYDPFDALQAADTVIKMVAKLSDLAVPGGDATVEQKREYHNSFSRFVLAKEEYSEKCKKEVLILWTDYFNEQNSGAFKEELHAAVWNATKLCSFNKRNVDLTKANELKAAVQKVAELF